MRLVLYKRGSIWWARGGRKFRKSTGHTDERKARLVANRWERELADPAHYRAHQATIASAAVRWMTQLRSSGKNPRTIDFYDQKIRHVARVLGDVRLSDLTHDRVLGFALRRVEEGAARYTVHRELTALRLTLRAASRAGEFGRPIESVMPQWGTGYVPRKTWIDVDDAWKLLAELEPGRAAAVALILATAADFSTAFAMSRSDVQEKIVHVRGTKRESRRREVPRITLLAPFLEHALTHADGEGDTLLRPWPNMVRDIKAACVRADVTRVTAIDLRRSTATWLLRSGVSFEVASKFLGHRNTRMLQEVYGQLDGAALLKAIEDTHASRASSAEVDGLLAQLRELPPDTLVEALRRAVASVQRMYNTRTANRDPEDAGDATNPEGSTDDA